MPTKKQTPGANIATSQSTFVVREIQFLTLQAALSTRSEEFPVYRNKKVRDTDRARFRAQLIQLLAKLEIEYTPRPVSDDDHRRHITKLSDEMSNQFPDLLHERKFRIGVAQKALNLYLKYLWCLGKIPEPPHCPFDNLVIGELDNCEGINWTEFDDIEIYDHLVEKARDEAKPLSPAEWELQLFNRR